MSFCCVVQATEHEIEFFEASPEGEPARFAGVFAAEEATELCH